jgi:hypothetical protein
LNERFEQYINGKREKLKKSLWESRTTATLERRKKHFSIQFRGQKGNFRKKHTFPATDHCAPVIKKLDMTQGDTKFYFSEIATLETGYIWP